MEYKQDHYWINDAFRISKLETVIEYRWGYCNTLVNKGYDAKLAWQNPSWTATNENRIGWEKVVVFENRSSCLSNGWGKVSPTPGLYCVAIVPSFGRLWGEWWIRLLTLNKMNTHAPQSLQQLIHKHVQYKCELSSVFWMCLICSRQYHSSQIQWKWWVWLHLLRGLFLHPEPQFLLRIQAEVYACRQFLCRQRQPHAVCWT